FHSVNRSFIWTARPCVSARNRRSRSRLAASARRMSMALPSSPTVTTALPPVSCMIRCANRRKLSTCARNDPPVSWAATSACSVWNVACSGTRSNKRGPAGSSWSRLWISFSMYRVFPLPERPVTSRRAMRAFLPQTVRPRRTLPSAASVWIRPPARAARPPPGEPDFLPFPLRPHFENAEFQIIPFLRGEQHRMVPGRAPPFDPPQHLPRVPRRFADDVQKQLGAHMVRTTGRHQIAAFVDQLERVQVDVLVPPDRVGHGAFGFGEGRRVEDDDVPCPSFRGKGFGGVDFHAGLSRLRPPHPLLPSPDVAAQVLEGVVHDEFHPVRKTVQF